MRSPASSLLLTSRTDFCKAHLEAIGLEAEELIQQWQQSTDHDQFILRTVKMLLTS
jgi:hypothetical protein